ncbi:response regulator [Propionispora vibrioides]|uniref:Response regulator receiver domain-containing protein n=1 Tax=Propionispora vibrioides TaxID=112903 RepID=A0A1H8U2H9_9FIRM|nr:response regulator [Propionispora vibrioides]SEO97482.1 Response regulator receiver domain-containing protein [Propionispora vibrioides]
MNQTTNGRILIVDDDEAYLASLRRIMRGHFDVVTTKDPVQALKIFEFQGPFAVVISDYRMPFMNGIELFSRIQNLDKQVQRIMLTGHAELQMAIDAINHGKINAFLTKPIPATSIRSIVIDSIQAYNQNQGSHSRQASNGESPAAYRLPKSTINPQVVWEKTRKNGKTRKPSENKGWRVFFYLWAYASSLGKNKGS